MEPSEAPEPQAAASTPGGSGPIVAEAAAEETDLSLDDIIRRNKKGQANPKGNRWQQSLKNRNLAYSNGRPRFRRWVLGNLQGRNRFRGNFRRQPFFCKPAWGVVTRPGQQAPLGPNGVSPLNRTLLAEQDTQDETPMDTDAISDGGEARDTQQGLPVSIQRFRNARSLPPLQSNKPFWKNQRPPFFQQQSRFNFGQQQQMQPKSKWKPPRIRRRQTQLNSGAIMTVSVSNQRASQATTRVGKRPFLRERSTPATRSHYKPKGVPLGFNFRAVANQTTLTLNERFSGLRHKRPFPARHSTDRMVTVP